MYYQKVAGDGLPELGQLLCIDIETGRLDEGELLHPSHNRIRSIQIHDCEANKTYIVLSNFKALKQKIGGKTWIGHNLHFDIGFLWYYLRILPNEVFDTQIAEGLVMAAQQGKPKSSLAAVTEKYIGKHRDKDIRMLWANNKPITSDMLDYAARDVTDLYPIYKRQLQELKRHQPSQRLLNLEMRICKWVALMALSGIEINQTAWRARNKKDEEALQQVDIDLTQMLGGVQRKTLFGTTAVQINFNSTKQVKGAFRKQGIMLDSISKSVLQELIPTYRGLQKDMLEKLVERAQYKAAISTFGEKWLRHVSPKTGKAYASFWQTLVETGRFSSYSPNFTNIPKHPPLSQFREFFVAKRGWCLLRADYSQQEARINAFLSKDQKLREAFEQGIDIYAQVARYMYDILDLTKETHPELRQNAKSLVLGLTYGMGIERLAFELKCSVTEAKAHRKKFQDSFPEVFENNERTKMEAARKGYAETYPLLRRRFLDPLDSGFAGQASNHPIQGTAADMMKLAILILAEQLDWSSQQLVNCVHDELTIHCRLDVLQQTAQLLYDSMMLAANLVVDIPFAVDIDAGTSWRDKSYNNRYIINKGAS